LELAAMLQYAKHRSLLTSLPTVEEVLDNHTSELGHDLIAYRNHVYRVVNLCLAIVGDSRVELEKIAVAAVFHDLGIWTNHTFDYIAPSVAIAREHLAARGMADWIPEIEAMIVDHHKVTPSRANPHPSTTARGALSGVEGQSLVESFRRADWIDVTRGLRSFGLPRPFLAAVAATWPSAGFHRRLVELTIDRFWKHPLNPLPMVKW
jgi:HD domain